MNCRKEIENEEELKHLIQLVSENDCMKSFEQLMNLYSPKLCHFSYCFVSSKETAEEIVSDVFLKIWKNRKNIKEVQNIESYLFIATKNHSLNYLKKPSSKFEFISIGDHPEVLNSFSTHDDAKLLTHELRIILEFAINQLPPQGQLVFRMLKEQNLKQRQVATILGISVKTVENHLAKSIKKLRDLLRGNISQYQEVPIKDLSDGRKLN